LNINIKRKRLTTRMFFGIIVLQSIQKTRGDSMRAKELFCAIIADIKDSTKLPEDERIEVQRILIQKIEEYNHIYEDKLALKIQLSRGDAIQALFYSPVDAYSFICELRDNLFPVCFRVGMGYGDWYVRNSGENIHAQDGTSFQNAAKAFEKAHDKKAQEYNKNIVFYSGKEIDAVLNLLLAIEDGIFKGQTNIQRQLAQLYSERFALDAKLGKDELNIYAIHCNKGSLKEIANEMQTTRQNLSQQLKRGKIYDQRELKAAILVLMQTHFSKKDDEN